MDKGRTDALEAKLAAAGMTSGTDDSLGAGCGWLSGAGVDSGVSEELEAGASSTELLSAGSSTGTSSAGMLSAGLLS